MACNAITDHYRPSPPSSHRRWPCLSCRDDLAANDSLRCLGKRHSATEPQESPLHAITRDVCALPVRLRARRDPPCISPPRLMCLLQCCCRTADSVRCRASIFSLSGAGRPGGLHSAAWQETLCDRTPRKSITRHYTTTDLAPPPGEATLRRNLGQCPLHDISRRHELVAW